MDINLIIDPINLILIILSGLTVIFTLFLCVLGTLAFLGWQSTRELRIKQREFLLKMKKIGEEGEKEIKRNVISIKKTIKEIEEHKIKIKTGKDIQKYDKKVEELINNLKESINVAERKIADIKLSNIPNDTVDSLLLNNFVSTRFPGDAVGGAFDYSNKKICKVCGKEYNDSLLGSVIRYCPHCGNLP